MCLWAEFQLDHVLILLQKQLIKMKSSSHSKIHCLFRKKNKIIKAYLCYWRRLRKISVIFAFCLARTQHFYKVSVKKDLGIKCRITKPAELKRFCRASYFNVIVARDLALPSRTGIPISGVNDVISQRASQVLLSQTGIVRPNFVLYWTETCTPQEEINFKLSNRITKFKY